MLRRVSFLFVALSLFTLAFAPVPQPRPRTVNGKAVWVSRTMEGFRTHIPPPQGLGEQNGLTVKELEPYLMSHLAGVAKRMGVKTKADCVALFPYLKDTDAKLRFLAVQALNLATNAYPHGTSVTWFIDMGSEGHAKMVQRFKELIAKMSP